MSKVGIVVPVLNQFKLAVEMITSVKTEHEVKIYPILNYKDSVSLSECWNHGCEHALADKCDYILIVNDDILFAPHTIDRLVDFMDRRQECKWDDVVLVSATNQRAAISPEDILSAKDEDSSIMITENPDFACFMIDARTIDLIGGFDIHFNPAYFEDNDYHYRINVAGYRAVTLHQAGYYHYGSQTQNSDPNNPVVPGFIFEINRLYYIGKWGGTPGYEKFSRPFDDPTKTLRDI